jgi:hypothetical protein
MSKTRDALPDAALFAPDGHLTEVALACVADGETDLLCARALEHLDGCDRCTHQLGEAALFSIVAGEALGDRAALTVAAPSAALIAMIPQPEVTTETPAPISAPISAPRRVRRPLPVAAIAAALLVAMMTAGPALLSAVKSVPAVLASALAAAPFLFRVASAFVRAPWGVGSVALLVKVVSTVILAGVGLQVARITSRSGSWQQGGV